MRVVLECDGDALKWQRIYEAMEDNWDIGDSIFYQMDYEPYREGFHRTEFGDMQITIEN